MNTYLVKFACVGRDDYYTMEITANSKQDVYNTLKKAIENGTYFLFDEKRFMTINLNNIEAIFIEDFPKKIMVSLEALVNE